ncbi:MAG: heat-inducible transcriptional repressor HrcA [Actinomycetota bacterium]|nr:heat-inducible transcriptional repressor HrcA [Actinomycetota bacterium]
MLDDRKAAILRAVVEEYIETAQPVGSASVARVPGLSVSSATVRNEMGALERDGYLAQPHTSAGRIPTDKGYRFFVDSLTPTGRLDASQNQQVRTFFNRAHGELERMLSDTSRFLAGLTDYAAVVVRDAEDPARIRSVQLVVLAPRVVLAVVVLASGAIEKRTLELAEDADEMVVGAASARLASHLVGEIFGTSLRLPDSEVPDVDRVVAAAVRSLLPGEEPEYQPQVFIGGAARMAAAFDAVGTIRQVLGILEQQYVLVSLVKDVLDRGLTVAIGGELGVQPLSDCSIVVAPYEIEGEPAGTVGILGPTRMHYEQTLAAVAVVSRRLGQALSKGSEER